MPQSDMYLFMKQYGFQVLSAIFCDHHSGHHDLRKKQSCGERRHRAVADINILTMIPEWIDRGREVIGCIMCYYTVNLGRGLFVSFLLLAVVMLFRKLPLFRNSFCRMIIIVIDS